MSHDKDVTVSFDAVAIEQWRILPLTVTLRHSGIVKFHRDPKDAAWSFLRIIDVPTDWPQSVSDDGGTLKLHDTLKPATGEFKYRIEVVAEDVVYTSPTYAIGETDPPIIINEV